MLLDKAWSSNGWKKTLDDPQRFAAAKFRVTNFCRQRFTIDSDFARVSAYRSAG
jgi:hypothetical protein